MDDVDYFEKRWNKSHKSLVIPANDFLEIKKNLLRRL